MELQRQEWRCMGHSPPGVFSRKLAVDFLPEQMGATERDHLAAGQQHIRAGRRISPSPFFFQLYTKLTETADENVFANLKFVLYQLQQKLQKLG